MQGLKINLKISLWSLELKRKFRDSSILLDFTHNFQDILTFCFNPKNHDLRQLGECILYLQFIDDDSGVPIVESTEAIDLSKTKHSLDIIVYDSIYIMGQSRKSYQLNVKVHHFLSLQEVESAFLAEKWNIDENNLKTAPYFPSLYIPSRMNRSSAPFSFLSVQDVNLSEVCIIIRCV